MYDDVLTLPLYDALLRLCTQATPVRVEPVTPPRGAKVRRWRAARVLRTEHDTVVVAVVAEIEGHTGCIKRLAND